MNFHEFPLWQPVKRTCLSTPLDIVGWEIWLKPIWVSWSVPPRWQWVTPRVTSSHLAGTNIKSFKDCQAPEPQFDWEVSYITINNIKYNMLSSVSLQVLSWSWSMCSFHLWLWDTRRHVPMLQLGTRVLGMGILTMFTAFSPSIAAEAYLMIKRLLDRLIELKLSRTKIRPAIPSAESIQATILWSRSSVKRWRLVQPS